ncbi:MAG TPA: hypothetical protein VFW65_14000 [Pseudonocardiaceae bacterium]|nr:hypothetical protein [Pseudonocardiaceae bacterium]
MSCLIDHEAIATASCGQRKYAHLPGQLAVTIAPEIAYSFTNTGRFVDTYFGGGGTHITMWTYDGTNLTGVDIPVTFYDATTPATQQGTSVRPRSSSTLATVESINFVQVYEIDPTTETQKGFVSFGTPGQDYTQPAAVMLDSGSVLVSYSVSSTSLFPSIGAIEVNPDMSLSAQQQVQFGNGVEDEAPGECANCARYGDFASAVLDPNNHQVASVDNEYTTANNQWNTWLNPITG